MAVEPSSAFTGRPRLFAALEMAFPVTFRPLPKASSPAAIIEVGAGGSDDQEWAAAGVGVPRIVFSEGPGQRTGIADVRLLERAAVDRRLREITLADQVVGRPLRRGRWADVLAASDRAARWTLSSGPVATHRVAAVLPELGPQEILRVALQREHSLSIVAITHFLRALCAQSGFQPPPVRAAIVFDDPNVRRPGYGFINYGRLVRHADAHGYHAVMATIPRDAVGAHAVTAALFRRRADRISLAFHGNDHVKNELMTRDTRSALRLCAQAVRRVAKFEARTGLVVDRVMTPPHGLCSQSVASSLAAVGFDALCAIHPEPWSIEPPADHLLAGWEPATFAGPLAVIPRFPLDAPKTEIALRAFMDNPVVLYGHHDDLAAGFDLLEAAAARVNSLGDVQWMSLGSIARSNVGWRMHDGTLVLRPYAARVGLGLPAGARDLVLEEPRDSGGQFAGWSLEPTTTNAFGAPVRCPRRDSVDIRLRPRNEVDPSQIQARTKRPWATARRAATEARDRAMPLRRVRRNRAGAAAAER